MEPLELVAEFLREHGYRIHEAMEKWHTLVVFKEASSAAVCEFSLIVNDPTKVIIFAPRSRRLWPKGSVKNGGPGRTLGVASLFDPKSLDKILGLVKTSPSAVYLTEEDYQ